MPEQSEQLIPTSDVRLIATTLPRIDWNREIPNDALRVRQSYHPESDRTIIQRLEFLRKLYEGDISPFFANGLNPAVNINHFRRVVDFNASQMLTEEPQISPPLHDTIAMMFTLMTERFVTGTAKLHPIRPEDEPEQIEIIPAEHVHHSADYDWIVTPWRNPTGDDLVDITRISETEERRTTHTTSGRDIGEQIAEETTRSLGRLISIPRSPRFNQHYGYGIVQDLIGPVVESNNRLTQNQRALDSHASPLLAWTLADSFTEDFARLYGALTDNDDPSKEEVETAVEKVLPALRQEANLRLPDGVEKLEYVTWDASLTASFEQYDLMLNAIRVLSAIPDVLEGGKVTGLRSGSQVRLEMYPSFLFYRVEQTEITPKLEEALKRLNKKLSRWTNPLDIIARMGMEDTAERDQQQGESRDYESYEGTP